MAGPRAGNRTRLRRGFFALILTLAAAAGSAQERYAVLVGVTTYPVLPAQFHLHGSVNDVTLMRSVLLARGFAPGHIRVLADGVPGAQAPTRSAILGALAQVGREARRGDFVYLHFAGHGSQQPEDPARTDRGHKPNGMNEIFLPRDIGTWNREGETVDNAIADYEMNAVVTGLRNQGVFVWAVFDSCHSASMTRGVLPGDLHFRQVDPVVLGVPPAALARAQAGARADRPFPQDDADEDPLGPPPKLEPGAAGFVAFYAAQTTETTPEFTLPRDAGDSKPQGLFSYTLAQAIASGGAITYRQLRDYVLQQYAALGYVTVTPLVEGTGLDAPIFGDRDARRVQQWRITRDAAQWKIAAGALHGIGPGARFAVLSNPLAADSESVGTLQAADVGNFESRLVATAPPAEGGSKAPGAAPIPDGAYARLLESAPDFSLTVAFPPDTTTPSPDQARMLRILAQMRRAPDPAARVTWVPAGQAADLRLSFDLDGPRAPGTPEQLWLLSPTGQLVEHGARRSHAIALAQPDEVLIDKLRDSLARIGRYTNLLRVATQLDPGAGGGTRIEALLTRAGSDHAEPLPTGVLPRLYSDDVVEFRIRNQGRQPADVTLLFLDSEYGISAMYPEPGRLNRIEAGADDTAKVRINADTTGVERMLAIVVDARPKEPHADFSFLEQPSLPARRGSLSAFESLLAEAAFGRSRTRGASPVSAAASAHMQLFSWATTAAPNAANGVRTP